MENGGADLGIQLATTHDLIRQTLEDRSNAITIALEEGRKQLDETINEQATGIAPASPLGASMLEMSFEDGENRLRNVVEQSTQKLTSAVDGATDSLTSSVEQTTGQLKDALSRSATDFEASAGSFSEKIAERERSLRQVLDATADSLDSRMQASAMALNANARKVEETTCPA